MDNKFFITMENFGTGEIRQVKIGLSWDCFFAFCLSFAPFFYRRIYKWALVSFLALIIITVAIMSLMIFTSPGFLENDRQISRAQIYTMLTMFVVHLFFLLNGNALTAQNYYKKGFIVTNSDDRLMTMAMEKLGLPPEAFLNPNKTENI